MYPMYFDYAATTPMDLRVANAMSAHLTCDGYFGNPASDHHYGHLAQAAVEKATQQVATLLSCDPRSLVWTSGATESINLAIKGAADFYKQKGKHIVTMATEHKAVLDSCAHLETQGYEVTYLKPDATGRLELHTLEAALRDDTILVSVMHVNNETGVIQDIPAIAALTRARGIKLHVDAVQSLGKIAIDLTSLPIDYLSLSAHKIYGPKGVGVLYTAWRPRARLTPLIHGGGQQRGQRSGTLATHQIVGMGAACEILHKEAAAEYQRIETLASLFHDQLKQIPGCQFNASAEHTVPHIINLRFDGIEAEKLQSALAEKLAFSLGSACTSDTKESSHVLRAMGFDDAKAFASCRFSLGRFTTTASVNAAVQCLQHAVTSLQEESVS